MSRRLLRVQLSLLRRSESRHTMKRRMADDERPPAVFRMPPLLPRLAHSQPETFQALLRVLARVKVVCPRLRSISRVRAVLVRASALERRVRRSRCLRTKDMRGEVARGAPDFPQSWTHAHYLAVITVCESLRLAVYERAATHLHRSRSDREALDRHQ